MEILLNHLRFMERVGAMASFTAYTNIAPVVVMQVTLGHLKVIATDGFTICQYLIPVERASLSEGDSVPFAISADAARVVGDFAKRFGGGLVAKPAALDVADSLSIAYEDVRVSVQALSTPTTDKLIDKMRELLSRAPLVRLRINAKRMLKNFKPGRLGSPSPATMSIAGDRATICYVGNEWSIAGVSITDSTAGGVTAMVDLAYLADAIRAAGEVDTDVIVGMSDSESPILVCDDKTAGVRFAEYIMPMLPRDV